MRKLVANPNIPTDVADAMVEFFSERCTSNEKLMPMLVAVKFADDMTFNEFGFRIKDLFV